MARKLVRVTLFVKLAQHSLNHGSDFIIIRDGCKNPILRAKIPSGDKKKKRRKKAFISVEDFKCSPLQIEYECEKIFDCTSNRNIIADSRHEEGYTRM